MDKSTGEVGVVVGEGEEEQNTTNGHAQHSGDLGVRLDEDRITAGISTVPTGARTDPFARHASCTAEIARGIKACDRGVMDRYPTVENGTVVKRHICRRHFRLRIELFVKKTAEQLGELGLLDMDGQGRKTMGIISF